MRLGVFGGTFNPVHNGHLVLAQEVREKMRLSQIIFVPSGRPPHKSERNLASVRHRLYMLKLSIEKIPFFSVSTIEIDRGGKSYSVETMHALRDIYGKNTKYFFILGADAVKEIFTWKKVREFLTLCELIVVNRPGFYAERVKGKLSHIHNVSITPIGISSSIVRERIRDGKSINSFVPEKVEEYIRRYKLYT